MLVQGEQHAVHRLGLGVLLGLVDQPGQRFAETLRLGGAQVQVAQGQMGLGGERSSSWAKAPSIAAVPAASGSATIMRRATRW